MKVKQYRWAFVGAFAAFVILAFVSQLPTMGASAEWNNGRYRFAGGTTPWALAYALLVIGLYISLMYASPSDEGPTLPGVIRRFVAFWLDFMLAMFALAPILGILPTITEWRRTGVFAWNFERTTPTPSDMLLASIILVLCSVSLVLYFALPLLRRLPRRPASRDGDPRRAIDGLRRRRHRLYGLHPAISIPCGRCGRNSGAGPQPAGVVDWDRWEI